MPYVSQDRREEAATDPQTPGELNYAICNLVREHLGADVGPNLTYQRLNDVAGALYLAGLEINRRLVVPFEERKCAANGDVF